MMRETFMSMRRIYIVLGLVCLMVTSVSSWAQTCTPKPGVACPPSTAQPATVAPSVVAPKLFSTAPSVCSPVGSWISSGGLGATVVVNADLTGTFSPSYCSAFPITVSQSGNALSVTATATDPSCVNFTEALVFAADCQSASGTFTNQGGQGGAETWTRTSGGAALTITQPADGTVFSYNGGYLSTDPITFQADPGANNAGVVVSWTLALEYVTSGDYGAYTSSQTFTTTGNATHNLPFSGTGGKVTVNASAMINGQTVNAQPVTLYVVGTSIPDATITPRLLSLYSGPTPRILVGIADRESTYRQFSNSSLYDQDGLWPTESGEDGGSHIGLMQMATVGANRIWSWMQNTADGASWLSVTKMGIARSLVSQIRKAHPSLPDLSALQYEQYAVDLYGNHPGKLWSQQYWVPVQSNPSDPKSAWVWQKGTANPLGIAYADDVYARSSRH